ncbi:MAG: hypothetical protein IKK59_04755 [Lachnospiraceae bacterium]|nr:hypothetical protein [Lachnospiraceae bacterium]
MFPGLTGTNSNETLKEMLCGMLVYGVLGQIVIWLFIRGIGVSLGWWIGVLTAIGCGYQMWWGLDRALDLSESEASKKMMVYSMFRYIAIVVIMAVVMITEIANPLAAVFGVFALKAGAYLQPLIHNFYKKRR